jgi:predicted methyltransferase
MKRITGILLVLALAACGQSSNEADTTVPVEPVETIEQSTQTEPATSIYTAAVDSIERPDADRTRDAGRKPAEVLEFLGIQSGMTVLDMFSGGGYYTEIISNVVGDDGHVIAHSNEAYLNFVGDEFENRYLGGRLANTEVLMAENNELSLKPGTIDAVMLVLSFHDLFYSDAENGWPAIDIETFLAELHSGLKAGGIVGIVDHYAAAGSPSETGGTTHRIDTAIVIESMTAAGFVLDGQSDILRNPDDNYEKSVFDSELRGKTDRFIMRFVKSE